ncbi:MAG TPA: ABC transporter permease subunit [Anaerolineales bacterium]|nr:ABC transporter permease subunit [Anaerolineales bacterium]
MRNIWTIAKKEYDHYFITPIAYIVAFVILLVLGFLFWFVIQRSISNILLYGYTSAPDTTLLSEWFVILLMFACPALTMRLLADETKTGTIELLLTAPVRDYELVVGKWLGSFLFILTIMIATLIYPVILNRLVTPGIDWQLVLSSYLGVMLAAASFLALGVGASALFSNQIAAYFIAFFICIGLLIFIGVPAQLLSAGGGFFEYVSMATHFYNSFNVGRIQLSDLIYYISLISLGLFTGIVAVESRRWT